MSRVTQFVLTVGVAVILVSPTRARDEKPKAAPAAKVASDTDNEVTNPFVVTEVYVKQDDKWKLASLSFTRLLTKE